MGVTTSLKPLARYSLCGAGDVSPAPQSLSWAELRGLQPRGLQGGAGQSCGVGQGLGAVGGTARWVPRGLGAVEMG